MTFKPISIAESGLDFNSQVSSNFKTLYDDIVYDKYKQSAGRKASKSFAPSSFRCDRLSFFRIRGVEPDPVVEIDNSLEFSAVLGTACHREIQSNLKNSIGDQWIDVEHYLEKNKLSHEYRIVDKTEFETQLEFINPPVKFSCDGLLRIENEVYLLEIKTSHPQSFKSLSKPKPQHIDQVKCYCSLLQLHKALILYQDRTYGGTKCYELIVRDYEMEEVFNRMNVVLDYVKKNLAPPKLPAGDYWCTYCKYKQRCKQWG